MPNRNYNIPPDFVPLAREFAMRVIEFNPDNIAEFGRGYFTALADGDLDGFFADQAAVSSNWGVPPPSNYQLNKGSAAVIEMGENAELSRTQLEAIFDFYTENQEGWMALVEFLLIARYFLPAVAVQALWESFGIQENSDDRHISKDNFMGYAMQLFASNLRKEDFQAGVRLAQHNLTRRYTKKLLETTKGFQDSDFPDHPQWDLHTSTRAGSLTAVRRILDAKGDVHAPDTTGKTPLHLAAVYGHKQIASLLLARGALVTNPIMQDSLTEEMMQLLTSAPPEQTAALETRPDSATPQPAVAESEQDEKHREETSVEPSASSQVADVEENGETLAE